MSQTHLQDYQDSPAARVELLDFLNRTGHPPAGTCSWEARLSHWWDQNPHASQHPLRGYIVRHEGRIVGYGGTIPSSYSVQGQRIPSLYATTLRADAEFHRAGIQMLMRLRSLGREVMVTHTTPIPKLQELLIRMGARAETSVRRYLFPTGLGARLTGKHQLWPKLDSSLRLTLNLDEVKSIAPLSRPQNRIEKWLCLDSLRWQLNTPMYNFRFLGAIDDTGTLHAYLILHDRTRIFRYLKGWDVVEAWTAHETPESMHALLGSLVHRPALLGPQRHWLTTTAFPDDDTWKSAPSLASRQQAVCHFFMLPAPLKELSKHTVMAEGDLVL